MASLQVDSVGLATALSPVGPGHFKFYHTTFIVGLRLRVHIPAKPKWTHENGFKDSENWETGTELYLTDKGISKVEEEIEKWKRERWRLWEHARPGL